MSKIIVSDEKKLLSALGLCSRARKIVAGVPLICDALKRCGKDSPKIVFMASDTSDNTQKRITDRCNYYGVKLIKLSAGSDELGRAVGKNSSLAAVAVIDEQLRCLTEKYIIFGQE